MFNISIKSQTTLLHYMVTISLTLILMLSSHRSYFFIVTFFFCISYQNRGLRFTLPTCVMSSFISPLSVWSPFLGIQITELFISNFSQDFCYCFSPTFRQCRHCPDFLTLNFRQSPSDTFLTSSILALGNLPMILSWLPEIVCSDNFHMSMFWLPELVCWGNIRMTVPWPPPCHVLVTSPRLSWLPDLIYSWNFPMNLFWLPDLIYSDNFPMTLFRFLDRVWSGNFPWICTDVLVFCVRIISFRMCAEFLVSYV
jgi:hypothetical protein